MSSITGSSSSWMAWSRRLVQREVALRSDVHADNPVKDRPMKTPTTTTTTTTTTRLRVWVGIALAVSGVLASAPMAQAAGPPAPGLGVAGSFAVLAGDGILMNGPTMITGDIGSFPAPTIGFGSLTLNGINHGGDAVTQGAKTDLTAAYTAAAASGPTIPVVGDLGGQTLTPGVYNSASSLAI